MKLRTATLRSLLRRALLPCACACLGVLARADLITGTVVTSGGAPVAFLDIDAKNNGSGGDPTLVNDGTNALGQFATTIPAGNYDLSFLPPAGVPGLVLTLENVNVSGVLNLGVIVLPPAFVLSGTCATTLGAPVAGVNLDVIDASGSNIDLIGDNTDAAGHFALAVPPGAIELRFDVSGLGTALASHALDLVVAGNQNLGTIALQPGNVLAGIVKNGGGVAVANCNIDVIGAGGSELYTPNDNTSASGTFVVVVPAGSYRVEVCAPFATQLVSKAVEPVVVAGPTNLGTITLSPGVVLSGSIKDPSNAPVPKADVDLYLAGTATQVLLCGDDANASGNYQVIVPLGTFDAVYSPPGFALPLSKQHVNGIVVAGNKVQNAVLPSCPFSTSYGTGLGGAGGVKPVLASTGGAPRVGNQSYAWRVSQGPANSFGVLGVGFGQLALPLFGGTVLIDIFQPYTTFVLFVDAGGNAAKPLPVPITSGLVGLAIDAQFFGLDGAAVQGISMSNGLQTVFCE